MLDATLIDLLACPETQQPVQLASDKMVQQCNDLINKGELVNRDQKKMTQPVDGLLVREDGRYAYPVMGNIPVLIVDEGIDTQAFA